MSMNKPRAARRLISDAVDDIIRKRFSRCETLPLFDVEPRRLQGFFEASATGVQMRIFDRVTPLQASRAITCTDTCSQASP
jgi:hypothetical protein